MKGYSLLSLTILLLSPLVFFAVFAFGITTTADYEHALSHPEESHNSELQQSTVNALLSPHHRSKRYVDPLISALLLGKSAFLLGTVLGPKLLHNYHHPPRRVHYVRAMHHGGGGGMNMGWGGWGMPMDRRRGWWGR